MAEIRTDVIVLVCDKGWLGRTRAHALRSLGKMKEREKEIGQKKATFGTYRSLFIPDGSQDFHVVQEKPGDSSRLIPSSRTGNHAKLQKWSLTPFALERISCPPPPPLFFADPPVVNNDQFLGWRG